MRPTAVVAVVSNSMAVNRAHKSEKRATVGTSFVALLMVVRRKSSGRNESGHFVVITGIVVMIVIVVHQSVFFGMMTMIVVELCTWHKDARHQLHDGLLLRTPA